MSENLTREDILVFLDSVEEHGFSDVCVVQRLAGAGYETMYPRLTESAYSDESRMTIAAWWRNIVSSENFEKFQQGSLLDFIGDAWSLAGLGCPHAREMALKAEDTFKRRPRRWSPRKYG